MDVNGGFMPWGTHKGESLHPNYGWVMLAMSWFPEAKFVKRHPTSGKKRLGVRHFAEVQFRLVEVEVQFGGLALQRHLVPPMALMAHDGSDASQKRPIIQDMCFTKKWHGRMVFICFLWDFRWFREIPKVGWEKLFGNEWMNGMILWWLLMFWRTGVFAGG